VFCSASRIETFSLLVEVLHDLEDLLDQLRRQAHRRLVEQDGAGPAHQRAADRRHLLLAARGVAGLAGAPQLEAREVVVDLLEVVGDLALAAMDEGAGQEFSSTVDGRSSGGPPSPG
jgi:hypothetical protein